MYHTVAAASWLMATKAQVVWTNEAFLWLIDLKKSFAKFFGCQGDFLFSIVLTSSAAPTGSLKL